jgi:hypothetical protein
MSGDLCNISGGFFKAGGLFQGSYFYELKQSGTDG